MFKLVISLDEFYIYIYIYIVGTENVKLIDVRKCSEGFFKIQPEGWAWWLQL
jgi:hypothetical protein